jgi:hypothetical protein
VTSNIWFTINLSQARSSLAATSSTNKIFFGGGGVIGKGLSNIVDIIGTPTSSNFTGVVLSPQSETQSTTVNKKSLTLRKQAWLIQKFRVFYLIADYSCHNRQQIGYDLIILEFINWISRKNT